MSTIDSVGGDCVNEYAAKKNLAPSVSKMR